MAADVRAIVISGFGTNCEREVAHACRQAGAQTDIVHISALLTGRVRLDDYHFLNLAGGFLDGDDLGSAKAGANRWMHARVAGRQESLADDLRRFVAAGKLVMGVCNGFQLLVQMGVLPSVDGNIRQSCSLTFNDRGRFENRWCALQVNSASPCVYTRGLTDLYLPIRHGEGKFVTDAPATLARLEDDQLIVVRYADSAGLPTMSYPDNPNGSVAAIAGICDPSGRIFGLMPHPEAYLHRTHHPRWAREDLPEEGVGLRLYRNAVEFIATELL